MSCVSATVVRAQRPAHLPPFHTHRQPLPDRPGSSYRARLVRQDLVYAKAAGFNTVRFIAGVAREDQLDFCDELGLMVYEETRRRGCEAGSPRTG